MILLINSYIVQCSSYPMNMSKAIWKYHDWCLNNSNIWVMPQDSELPYCTNIYGDKVRP